jgi:hypothetical protein
MNASIGDVFNDGRLAIYKTNISEQGALVQGNDLWVPRNTKPKPKAQRPTPWNTTTWRRAWVWSTAAGAGAHSSVISTTTARRICISTNGYVSAGERSSYWYDFAVIAVGHSQIIGDAANWPAMKGRSLSGYQRKRVWINDGLGRFTTWRRSSVRDDTFDGRAVALADLGNRGVLDVIVANQRGPLLIYKNTVDLAGTGFSSSSRAAAATAARFGARVELHWNGHVQVQEVSAATASARRTSGVALRAWRSHDGRSRGHPLAVGHAADHRAPTDRHAASGEGALRFSSGQVRWRLTRGRWRRARERSRTGDGC